MTSKEVSDQHGEEWTAPSKAPKGSASDGGTLGGQPWTLARCSSTGQLHLGKRKEMRLSELGGNWRVDQTKAKRVHAEGPQKVVRAISLALPVLTSHQ